MEPDYPAAHSTDASWYAVDKNGNVALFITGAGGAIPNSAYSPEGAEYLDEIDPEEREELGLAEDLPADQLPDDKHVFHYETRNLDECLADRYERRRVPKKPLHIDQLPPRVRAAIEKVCFESLDFSNTKVFQPVELTECATWDPAYLAGDGKSVKPVPGREREYAQFVNDFRGDLEGDGLTVEEPPKKKPSKKKPSPRRKKKGGRDGT
jgi:hypothetical protein